MRGNPNKHFTMPYQADYPKHWNALPGETSAEYWDRVERQDRELGYVPRRGPMMPTPRPCTGLRSRGVNQTESERALLPTPVANPDNKSPEAHLAMKARMKGGPRYKITDLQVWAKANGVVGLARPNSEELLATPTKRDWKSGKASQATHDRNSRPLSEQACARGITGTAALLTLVEWMMGYPARWLLDAAWAVPVSPPMGTRSSQRSPKSSGAPSPK